MLVQAVGETILPIVPHIDDYECVICTSIAFKPIRLQCGHLFCVRYVFVLLIFLDGYSVFYCDDAETDAVMLCVGVW